MGAAEMGRERELLVLGDELGERETHIIIISFGTTYCFSKLGALFFPNVAICENKYWGIG